MLGRCPPTASSIDDGHDAGMVTVEAAIALAAFVTVVVLAIAGVVALLDQIRCTDAAREAARLVARGEPDRATDAVHRIAPNQARVTVSVVADEVNVEVTARAAGGLLPGLKIGARAYAVAEPKSENGSDAVPAGAPG